MGLSVGVGVDIILRHAGNGKTRVVSAARIRLAFVPAIVRKAIMVETVLGKLRMFAICYLLSKARATALSIFADLSCGSREREPALHRIDSLSNGNGIRSLGKGL